MTECCRNCKYLRNLWWWKNYPEEKQYGYCCTLFNNSDDDYTIMQIYDDIDQGMCECFSKADEPLVLENSEVILEREEQQNE